MVGVVAVVGYNWFDGLCVCGFVVAEVAGSSGFPMVFFFFLIWVFVPMGFW